MADVFLDALIDSLKVFPFLIFVYVLIEVFEHTASSAISARVLRGKLSPLIGAGVGVIPQCGFSVVATKLYANRSIALGTLLAVYISTSDEAVAVLISSPGAALKIIPLLMIKFVFAVIVGYVFNYIVRKRVLSEADGHVSAIGCHHHVVGQDDDCGHCHEHENEEEHKCEDEEHKKRHKKNAIKRFILHPIIHSLTTLAFIFSVNLVLNILIYYVTENTLINFMGKIEFLQPLLAAIVGLIPNCAASVVIAQMFAKGTLSLGGAVSGLCVSAGIALAVLIKENKKIKDTLMVIGLLFVLSVLLGIGVTAIIRLI